MESQRESSFVLERYMGYATVKAVRTGSIAVFALTKSQFRRARTIGINIFVNSAGNICIDTSSEYMCTPAKR
jgi:hypothetical protein